MKQTRMLGNYVYQIAKRNNKSIDDLCSVADCTVTQMKAFLKGRALFSYEQLTKVMRFLNIHPTEIMKGDEGMYNKTVVHCMKDFDDNEKREQILDIIDMYLDVKDFAN